MSRGRADALLLLIAIIWGTTFPLVHGVTQHYPPLALIALRFGLAALAMLPMQLLLARGLPRLGRRGWLVALALGGTLFLGFAAQTLGLQRTTAARGGFITGLNVVIVPFLGLLLLRQRPPLRALAGLALALVGMAILTLDGQSSFGLEGLGLGDLLVLGCAFAFALHIVLISWLARAIPAVQLNAAQMVVVALLAVVTALSIEGPTPPTLPVLGVAAFLGLVATALVFALQLAVQRHTTPTHTALIFALEPVFAALFAALLGGERLTLWTLGGGSLMLLGVLLAEVPVELALRRWRRPAQPVRHAPDADLSCERGRYNTAEQLALRSYGHEDSDCKRRAHTSD